MPRPKTPFPQCVRVLGRTFKASLAPIEDLEGNCGLTTFAPVASIQVADGQDPLDTADTYIHEIMHAILHRQGRESGGKVEEMYVRALATGLVTVFQENPAILSYLQTTLCSTPTSTPRASSAS